MEISFTDFRMALPLLLNMRRRKIYLFKAKHCLVIGTQSRDKQANETKPIFLTTVCCSVRVRFLCPALHVIAIGPQLPIEFKRAIT
jgi:hypothetical protein